MANSVMLVGSGTVRLSKVVTDTVALVITCERPQISVNFDHLRCARNAGPTKGVRMDANSAVDRSTRRSVAGRGVQNHLMSPVRLAGACVVPSAERDEARRRHRIVAGVD